LVISASNHERRSASSTQFSIKLAVAMSLCFSVLFFTLVAEEWSISKADGEPADFGHDMERQQEVENDGQYAGLADERSGITVTYHLDILVIKAVEKREVLFVMSAFTRALFKSSSATAALENCSLFIGCPLAHSGFTHQT
jgi:hypothetical protein